MTKDNHPRDPLSVLVAEARRQLDPLSVSVAEARRLSGLGNTTVYRLIGEGRLRVTKIGTRTLVDYASLKALLASTPEAAT
jgi:excisionase family DNA binding protein